MKTTEREKGPPGAAPRGTRAPGPPSDIEAEMALLGTILIDPDILDEVRLSLAPPAFYRVLHQRAFEAMCSLADRGESVDWVTVTDEMARRGTLDSCGGRETVHATLAEMTHATPSSLGLETWSRLVRDAWTRRAMLQAAGELRDRALDPAMDAREALEVAERRLLSVADRTSASPVKSASSVIDQVLDANLRMVEWRKSGEGNGLPGLASGYEDLDNLTTGWKPGELVLIGARPGQGKTSLLMNIAENLIRRGDGVAAFSLEMTAPELMQRLLCIRSGLPLIRLRTGALTVAEQQTMHDTATELRSAPIWIDDTFTLTLADIRSKARRLRQRQGIKAVLVDYVQLAKVSAAKDRWIEVGEVTRGLKALARELQVPVLAAAQLSREIEKGMKRPPKLSDLRESGSMEQDADQVLLLHQEDGGDGDSHCRLLVAKNRNGPTGSVDFVFQRPFTRFLPRASQQASRDPEQRRIRPGDFRSWFEPQTGAENG